MLDWVMAVRADILEVARVLQEAAVCPDLSKFQPPSPLGADASIYAKLMTALPRHKDVPRALAEANLRPLFLVNGLVHAAALTRQPRRVLLESLAAGLLEFVDYFELIADRAAPRVLAPDAAARLQKRYFAYCQAQLIECGFSVTAALTTMKGDALDEDVSYEIRGWLEQGPESMLSSGLLTQDERGLWAALFRDGRHAWPALRSYLVQTYQLPFRPLRA